MFPAFEDAELLTFGSGSQTVDYEAEWRRRLQEAGGKRVAQGGWSNKVAGMPGACKQHLFVGCKCRNGRRQHSRAF